MAFEEHPGFLGSGHLGPKGDALLIHAAWPVYPFGPGWRIALRALGAFPRTALFRQVDDIDRCLLLAADGFKGARQGSGAPLLHVAVWHEDLLELSRRGLVVGVEAVTERAWEERRRQEMRRTIRDLAGTALGDRDPLDLLSITGPTGVPMAVRLPDTDDLDDESPAFAAVAAEGLAVTSLGHAELEEGLSDALELSTTVKARIGSLLASEVYDAAVREVAVMLESALRTNANLSSDHYGKRLVDEYIRQLQDRNRYVPASVKNLECDLQTAFKFIRNEFAHNIVDLERSRAYALITRLVDLLEEVQDIGIL